MIVNLVRVCRMRNRSTIVRINHMTKMNLESFKKKSLAGAPHRVRLVQFPPYQIFWIKMSFLSFYSEYEIEFRVPYEIPNSIGKLTFHIHPALLLFDAQVERQPRSIAIFYSNIFPAVDAMR